MVHKTKTETVMELAHAHPMAGHLRVENTVQRIQDQIHWPGLDAEILPQLPNVPADVPLTSSPQPANPTAGH